MISFTNSQVDRRSRQVCEQRKHLAHRVIAVLPERGTDTPVKAPNSATLDHAPRTRNHSAYFMRPVDSKALAIRPVTGLEGLADEGVTGFHLPEPAFEQGRLLATVLHDHVHGRR